MIGGDIFVRNSQNTIPSKAPWSAYAGCIGIASGGGVRIYGTHFDVEQDSGSIACIGVLTFSAGIISGKFESTQGMTPTPGIGVYLAGSQSGGQTAQLTTNTFSKVSGVVTVTTTPSNSLKVGQAVSISTANSTNFDGFFLVVAANSSTFQYEYAGPNATSASGTVTPKLSLSVDVDGIFNGMKTEVQIDYGAYNNTVLDMSSNLAAGGVHVQDKGTNDFYRVSHAGGGNNPSGGYNTLNLSVGAVGTNGDAVKIQDANNAAGTGHLLNVQTSSGSGAKPVAFGSNTAGVEMNTAGVLAPVGGGHITADQPFSTTCSIPANFFTLHKVLKVWVGFDLASTSAPGLTLKMKLGTTTAVYTSVKSTGTATGSPSTFVSGVCSFILQGTNTPGASVPVEVTILRDMGSAANAGLVYPCGKNAGATQSVGLNTAGGLSLNFAGLFDTAGSNSNLTLTQLIVETLN